MSDFVRAYDYLLSDEFMAGHNLHVINMSLAVALDEEDAGEVGLAEAPSSLHAASTEDGGSFKKVAGKTVGTLGEPDESGYAAWA